MASAMAGGVRALLVAGLLGLTMGRPVDPSHGNASAPAPDFSIHVFQVGQGDSQLIRLPSGYTILNDIAEMNWNTCKGGELVAEKVLAITGSRHIDVGVVSHWHLDHLGYTGHGGFWCVIERGLLTFGKLIDRDGAVFRHGGGNNDECTEETIEWRNVGTVSGTAINWVCYFSDPASKVHAIREVAVLGSSTQIAPPDAGAEVTILITDARGVKMADGTTDVGGDHREDQLPPSENDYCIGLLIRFGDFTYVTAGDLDGDYAVSTFGYTYNDAETVMAKSNALAQGVDVLHANHHGSSHSTNQGLVNRLRPQASFISCGYDNSYGHPAQPVLDRLLASGDVFLPNICDPVREYGRSVIANGDVTLTSASGRTFRITGRNHEYVSKLAVHAAAAIRR